MDTARSDGAGATRSRAYLALVLHAHLPFVRHPEHAEFLEEKWLFEAMTESYLPLVTVLERLVADGVDFRLTIGLTPPLLEMLSDDLLMRRYRSYLDRLIDLAARESRRLHRHVSHGPTARFYRARFEALRENLERMPGGLTGSLRRLQRLGHVEILASSATHAYSPHLRQQPTALRAQIAVGVEAYRRNFGEQPAGYWLPECAFFPGLDSYLADVGIRYFFVETHGLLNADPRPLRGVYAPLVCPAGVAAFARDPETSHLVWSSRMGYPGDPWYREFYRDIGYDLPVDVLRDSIGPDGIRVPSGLKYHRVTGPTSHKQAYVRERALARVEAHATDFVAALHRRQSGEEGLPPDRSPLFVSPYDAELFGHWWFEGPEWLDRVLRRTAEPAEPGLLTVTPSEYLAEYPSSQPAVPSESSWGEGGYHEVWLNEDNDGTFTRRIDAAARMIQLASRHARAEGVLKEALDLCAREVLLSQSSDWTFLVRVGTASEYAARRIESHLGRFERIAGWIESGQVEGEVAPDIRRELQEIGERDTIFPWLDYTVFALQALNAGAGADPARRREPSACLPTTVSKEEEYVREEHVTMEETTIRPRVAFLTAEATPFAKVGGLADVCGALPAALSHLGVEVDVLLPAYRTIDRKRFDVRPFRQGLRARVGEREVTFDLLQATPPARGPRVFLVDQPEYFDREGIYVDPGTGEEYDDTAERFIFFSRASLEALRELGQRIDILHCHDYQTALALPMRRLDYRWDPLFSNTAGILTVHNLGYQGVFGPETLDLAGIRRDWFYPTSPFEYYGKVNFLKAGIVLADKVNAVSERYAREICENPTSGAGLDGVLRDRGDDLVGILNGIDVDEWNPATDPLLPANFDATDLSGKSRTRAALLEAMGLRSRPGRKRVPLVGMVTRLVDQKGLDLIERGIDELMSVGIHLVVLGTGLPRYHQFMEDVSRRYRGRIGVALAFDNRLAHLIEGGADMFLMPSLYEPCGLNQMYSLRYGTIPIVRATGGLADTVRDDDAHPGKGVGFSFDAYDEAAMVEAVRRAVNAYHDTERWHGLVQRAMAQDHSWEASAAGYLDLYRDALARREALGQNF